MTDNQYHSTGTMLRILAIITLVSGLYSHSIPLVAIACGYWLASGNPWRYRIMINVGIIFHSLQFARGLYCLVSADYPVSYVDLLGSPVVLAVLLRLYPTPYDAWSNVLAYILPAGWMVSAIEAYPAFIKKLTGKGIIGSVEGLYINSDAFNILQEEGFLGFTPAGEVAETAKQAGVQGGKSLLDVGCGIGGPACLLAGRFGLNVTGVDLLEWNVAAASSLAASRGLSDTCRFKQANALSLPFEDGIFDYVFGMDAWCHVPDRYKLLQESHRVMKQEGTILFHDWVMNKGDSEGFRFIYAFPPLETVDSYSEKLGRAGFEIVTAQLRTAPFRAHVIKIRNNVLNQKRRLIDICGRELYDNWNAVTLYTLRMIEEEKLTSGLFIARKK